MKLLVIGAGRMGSAAAYEMARTPEVEAVTLADQDRRRARQAAQRINRLTRARKVSAIELDASRPKDARRWMRDHAAALSAVPYFYNLELARAAIEARCHFADLGGNNDVVRQEYALARKAEKRGVALAPDCGLSPGVASVLAGELMRRVGGRAAALKIYVGGLPQKPKPPFHYQLVFSVEGLINEYAEPARILRGGKIRAVEPLSEIEPFAMPGLPPMEAFHTSGGSSTLPETFAGRVGECFEKTLRYPGHAAMMSGLKQLGLFSREPRRLGRTEISPRVLTAALMEEKLAGEEPDLTILRVEAHPLRPGPLRGLLGRRRAPAPVLSFTLVDRYDAASGMSAMMRTTAWPAAIIVRMLASGEIAKRGGIRQETDVPALALLAALAARGVKIEYEEATTPF